MPDSSKRDPDDWKKPSRYFQSLGMSIAEKGGGRATLNYVFDEAFGNRKGDVQGGVLAGLIDIAMSEAIRSTLDDSTSGRQTAKLLIPRSNHDRRLSRKRARSCSLGTESAMLVS